MDRRSGLRQRLNRNADGSWRGHNRWPGTLGITGLLLLVAGLVAWLLLAKLGIHGGWSYVAMAVGELFRIHRDRVSWSRPDLTAPPSFRRFVAFVMKVVTVIPMPGSKLKDLARKLSEASHAMTSAAPPLPPNTRFGWLFTVVFLVAAIYEFVRVAPVFSAVLLFLSIATAITTLAAPDLLRPLNRLWFAFGLLLGRIVSPVVLGAIFFLLLTPVGLLARAAGRDVLHLKKRKAASYWLDHEPAGSARDSFRNQF